MPRTYTYASTTTPNPKSEPPPPAAEPEPDPEPCILCSQPASESPAGNKYLCSTHDGLSAWQHPLASAITLQERRSHALLRKCSAAALNPGRGSKRRYQLCNNSVGMRLYGYCHRYSHHDIAIPPVGTRASTGSNSDAAASLLWNGLRRRCLRGNSAQSNNDGHRRRLGARTRVRVGLENNIGGMHMHMRARRGRSVDLTSVFKLWMGQLSAGGRRQPFPWPWPVFPNQLSGVVDSELRDVLEPTNITRFFEYGRTSGCVPGMAMDSKELKTLVRETVTMKRFHEDRSEPALAALSMSQTDKAALRQAAGSAGCDAGCD